MPPATMIEDADVDETQGLAQALGDHHRRVMVRRRRSGAGARKSRRRHSVSGPRRSAVPAPLRAGPYVPDTCARCMQLLDDLAGIYGGAAEVAAEHHLIVDHATALIEKDHGEDFVIQGAES